MHFNILNHERFLFWIIRLLNRKDGFMTFILLLVAIVILLCVIAEKFSGRFGMPALILFMFIGMLFGSDGIFKIPFNDYKLAENI